MMEKSEKASLAASEVAYPPMDMFTKRQRPLSNCLIFILATTVVVTLGFFAAYTILSMESKNENNEPESYKYYEPNPNPKLKVELLIKRGQNNGEVQSEAPENFPSYNTQEYDQPEQNDEAENENPVPIVRGIYIHIRRRFNISDDGQQEEILPSTTDEATSTDEESSTKDSIFNGVRRIFDAVHKFVGDNAPSVPGGFRIRKFFYIHPKDDGSNDTSVEDVTNKFVNQQNEGASTEKESSGTSFDLPYNSNQLERYPSTSNEDISPTSGLDKILDIVKSLPPPPSGRHPTIRFYYIKPSEGNALSNDKKSLDDMLSPFDNAFKMMSPFEGNSDLDSSEQNLSQNTFKELFPSPLEVGQPDGDKASEDLKDNAEVKNEEKKEEEKKSSTVAPPIA